MKYIITKKIVNSMYQDIDKKFNYECNSFSREEAFIQPITYIKGRFSENEENPQYDNRFLDIIKEKSDMVFDQETIHKLSLINKKFNSLRDYHRDEYIENVESKIETLRSIEVID